jgi:hypothetical protein
MLIIFIIAVFTLADLKADPIVYYADESGADSETCGDTQGLLIYF